MVESRMPASPRVTTRRSNSSYSFDSQSNGSGNGRGRPAGSRSKDKSCQYCEKTFKKTEHLMRHERSHTKEKPFRCELCRKVYTRHDTLLRHSKTHGLDPSHLQAGITLSQMNNDGRTLSEDNGHGTEHNVVEQTGTNFEPHLESMQDWRNETSEPINTNAMPNGYASQASSLPTVYPSVNLDDNLQSMNAETSMQASGQAQFMQTSFPVLMGNAHLSPSSANNLWGASLMSPGPSWLVDYDFDLEALNTSVSATMGITEPLFQSQMNRNALLSAPQSEVVLEGEGQKEHKLANDSIRRGWFSHIDLLYDEDDPGRLTTGHMTPVTAEDQYDIGDSFRHRISQRLKARTNDEPLPSTQFLNLSVQIYFTKFNAIFPVIHGQTFRPTPKNSLLLLSITSIGSLILGSKGAAAQGIRIFERLNKAILASWETTLLSDPTEAASMIQAALVGQTFGLLSGIPQHLAIVEAFHGSVITWARRCGMFIYRRNQPEVEHLSGTSLYEAWKAWARTEEIVRTVLGLYIHDAKLACMFHHEPLLRHDSILVSIAADDDLFNAPSATIWREKMLLQSTASRLPVHECLHTNLHPHTSSQPLPQELSWQGSHFTAYVILHGIHATISEKQQMSQFAPSSAAFTSCFSALMCWYTTFDGATGLSSPHPRPDTLCLLVLWHTVFMSLLTKFNLLERAIGRNGSDSATAAADTAYATTWATSREAQRTILHAHALLYSLGAMRLDAEAAIHIPHCLFLAGIASYCYTRFRRPQSQSQSLPLSQSQSVAPTPVAEFPEFAIRGAPVTTHLFGSPSASAAGTPAAELELSSVSDHIGTVRTRPSAQLGAAMMCTLVDMLQRVGHWGIARKYAATLSALVFADSEEDWKFISSEG